MTNYGHKKISSFVKIKGRFNYQMQLFGLQIYKIDF